MQRKHKICLWEHSHIMMHEPSTLPPTFFNVRFHMNVTKKCVYVPSVLVCMKTLLPGENISIHIKSNGACMAVLGLYLLAI